MEYYGPSGRNSREIWGPMVRNKMDEESGGQGCGKSLLVLTALGGGVGSYPEIGKD